MYYILLSLVLGHVIPQAYINGLIAAFILYNITSTLYVVPIAYVIARKTSQYLRIKTNIQ
ncbi:MAG: hypothetical protein ACQCN6_07095 [Candidatus Bathyarchaeia archaeon]